MSARQTYSERLQDPQWKLFREDYIARHTKESEELKCRNCGDPGPFHLHHRRYIRGREPWEYEDADLILICVECHTRVHDVAREFHDWLISILPHEIYEARDLLEELVKCKTPAVAMARCKNAVRSLNFQ